MIAGLAHTSDGARLVAADYLDCAEELAPEVSVETDSTKRMNDAIPFHAAVIEIVAFNQPSAGAVPQAG
jgi:hypothetical protein